jgi:polyhydroxyalkanoate synthesis regulator phasin
MAVKGKVSKAAQRKKKRENVIKGLIDQGYKINTKKASPYTQELVERRRRKKLKVVTSPFVK